MTHYITENILPFPPDLGQHQPSPGTEKTEALPLKVSNFSLAFYRSEPYAAVCQSLSFTAPCALPSLCVSAAACVPPTGRLKPQLTLPWHQDLHGISCKECPNPRESSVSERSEHQMAGRRAVAFLLTAELPSFRVPPLLP